METKTGEKKMKTGEINGKLANKKGKTRNNKNIKQRNKEKCEEKLVNTRGTISERDENSDQKLKPSEKYEN